MLFSIFTLFNLGEADQETNLNNINSARTSSNKERPSEIMKVIEEGFAQITDSVSEGVEKYLILFIKFMIN